MIDLDMWSAHNLSIKKVDPWLYFTFTPQCVALIYIWHLFFIFVQQEQQGPLPQYEGLHRPVMIQHANNRTSMALSLSDDTISIPTSDRLSEYLCKLSPLFSMI